MNTVLEICAATLLIASTLGFLIVGFILLKHFIKSFV